MDRFVTTYGQTLGISFEHSLQIQLCDLAFEATCKARIHGGATAEHDVLVEVGSYVHVGLLYCVEEELGYAHAFAVGQMRLEEDFGRFEALATQFNDATVW